MNYKINQLRRDDFGRPSGVLLIDKPEDFTSHDVVGKTRGIINYKKVGHAGALDPFATGLMIILVGKSTKLSDSFMTLDKSYEAEILFGISTKSQDTEGEIIDLDDTIGNQDVNNFEAELSETIGKLSKGYDQFVPVYSSVKIDGKKLRKLARGYKRFETYFEDNKKFVRFIDDNKEKVVELPRHRIDFTQLRFDNLRKIKLSELRSDESVYKSKFIDTVAESHSESINKQFFIANIITDCPKGTYIRQLAEDIGNEMGNIPSMVTSLRRLRIGNYHIEDALSFDDIGNLD